MFCLCSLPGVWWCLVLYLSLSAILSLFLCRVWRCVPVSLIWMKLSRFPSTNCWKDCLFPILCSCLLCQRLIDHRCVWVYLWVLYSVPLVCMSVLVPGSLCRDDYGFVILPEVWKVMPPAWFLFLRIPGNSGSFVVPYKFLDCLL